MTPFIIASALAVVGWLGFLFLLAREIARKRQRDAMLKRVRDAVDELRQGQPKPPPRYPNGPVLLHPRPPTPIRSTRT